MILNRLTDLQIHLKLGPVISATSFKVGCFRDTSLWGLMCPLVDYGL